MPSPRHALAVAGAFIAAGVAAWSFGATQRRAYPQPGETSTVIRGRADLTRLARPDAVLTSADVTRRLAPALTGSDPSRRQAALDAIAARIAPMPQGTGVERLKAWRQQHAWLRPLSADVMAQLDDQEEGIRRAAVGAAVVVGMTRPPIGGRYQMDPQVVRALARAFATEPSAPVRIRMAVLLPTYSVPDRSAGTTPPEDHAVIDDWTVEALRDANSEVVTLAIRAAGIRQITAALPVLATRVTDFGSPRVRLMAADALGAFGPAALPYAAGLESAARTEPDPLTRLRLLRSLAAVRGQ